MTANVEMIRLVAARLPEIQGGFVFVGGTVVDLLVDDPAAFSPRATDDVDTIVGVSSNVEVEALNQMLRTAGFRHDMRPGAPICRWLLGSMKVDVMPSDASLLGFSSRWYPEALLNAVTIDLPDGPPVRTISAPYFIATKLEAFRSRGGGDYRESKDIQDIVAVVDGRARLPAEIARAPATVRPWLAAEVGSLLGTEAFLDALPGHLCSDEASQGRLPLLLSRLRAIQQGRSLGPGSSLGL